jgi:hypothetical protein
MCYQMAANLVSTPFLMWQAADRERLMKHAVTDELNRLKGFSQPASAAVNQTIGAYTPVSYQQDVGRSGESAAAAYGSSRVAPSGSATDRAAYKMMDTSAGREQGWNSAAVNAATQLLGSGSKVNMAGQLAKTSLAPLSLEIKAAQGADQWASFLASLLGAAGGGADSINAGTDGALSLF